MLVHRSAGKPARGFSLASVLFLSMLAFVVLWCMFSTSYYQVAFVENSVANDMARDWANNAILLAIDSLKNDPAFSEDTTYDPELGGSVEAVGLLTFRTGSEPYSTNNLVSSVAVTGWNDTLVPPHAAHLVAVGRHQGKRQVMEAIVVLPPFPYSVASEGFFKSEGSLEVFSIDSLADLNDGISPDEKKPGHIVSNSGDPPGGAAITLSKDTTVTGDARAVGSIETNGAVVANLLPGSSAVPLPEIRATDFDPAGLPYTYAYTPGTTVAGRARHSGSLTLGDLKLENGLLYVEGHLTINGTISGQGAIVASGDLTVNGSMAVSSDFAALVAGKDLTLTGAGPGSSSVQGIAYAGGSFRASQVRIVGPYLQADPEGAAQLTDVVSVHTPELTAVELSSGTKLEGVTWNDLTTQERGVRFTEKTLADVPRLPDGRYDSSPAAVASLIEIWYQGAGPFSHWNQLPAGQAQGAARDIYDDLIRDLPGIIEQHNTQGTPATQEVFRLDYNQLLNLSDRIRVLLWRSSSPDPSGGSG